MPSASILIERDKETEREIDRPREEIGRSCIITFYDLANYKLLLYILFVRSKSL